jgi:hypothetical protein
VRVQQLYDERQMPAPLDHPDIVARKSSAFNTNFK